MLAKLLYYFLLLFITLPSIAIAESPKSDHQHDFSTILRGRTVGNIYVDVKDIFPEEENLRWLYRKANQWKITTQNKVILRELTFKSGMTISQLHLNESARNIRTLDFIRRVDIKPILVDDQTFDVYVEVQDTWTLIPQISYSSGDGRNRNSFGLAESDLLGLGKRLEFLVKDDDGRKTTQTVYDDRRLFGSTNQLELASFNRTDGNINQISLGKPFRTLFDQNAYGISLSDGDTAESLYKDSDERYVYRDNNTNFDIFYSFSIGEPSVQVRRYSFGYSYSDTEFEDASLQDYEDLDVDPNDPNLEDIELPTNRRYSGPYFAYETLDPNYISKNYIDRFDRFDDYNLGVQSSYKLQLAPESLGSIEDAILFSGATGAGWLLSEKSFLRGEIGLGTRYIKEDSSFENSILHSDLRYYKTLGHQKLGGLNLGNHTLAAALTMEYSKELDRDKEFLLGADNYLRGYSARTFSGDKRIVINLEDRIHWAEDVWKIISIGSVFFLDIGTSTYDSLDQALQNEIYSDFGLGLRIGLPRSSGSKVLRFDIAFPTRDGPDGTKALDPRFLFSVSQSFNSFLRTELNSKQRASVDSGF